MIKTMRAYKLELGDTDEVQKKFAQDMASIKEAAWENHGNLTDSDKGAYTRAGNNVTKIQNDAQGLYNNADAGKAQQVAKEVIDTTDKMAAAQNRNAQSTKDATERQKQLGDAAAKAGKQQLDEYKNVEKEAQKYVDIQDSIKNGFDSLGRGAKQILSVTTTWRSLKNVVKSTFNDIKGLDKAFANIAMVTSYSVKDLWGQYDQYAEMANRLGQSTQSVVEASGLYYQQGLKTNEVLKLTEETMKLATLAGLDFKEATSQMTAALRAFHMDMSDGAHVTDVYAEVAAHAAVDVQGLSEAMSATAAIAHSAGMSFENTTAMLATMVEATQEAPKNLGTAMKTILARFTELKTNVAGTADSEFDDLDYNKVDKALKSVGVSIKGATGQFRNMDEVLLELSSKWKGLDRNSQRYIATIAAGSRQQSRFIALMENYERTMELVNVATNSAGRSSQQFAKYQDSVEYKVKKLENTWEQFRTNMLTSDFYKDLLDNFSGFLNKLNNTSVGGLITLGTTWLTVGRSAISNAISGWSDLGSGLIGKLGGMGKVINKEEFKDQFRQQHQNEFAHNGILDDQSREEIDAASEEAFSIAQNKAKVKSKAIGTIISTGLTTAITTGFTIDNPITAGLSAAATSAMALLPTFVQIGKTFGAKAGVGIGLGITTAIMAVSMTISNLRQRAANAEKTTLAGQAKAASELLKQSQEKLDSKRDENKSTKNEINNLKDIQKEITELNSKVVLTEEEQEKYNDLVATLKEEYPSLISQYDQETGKIKLNNSLLEERVKILSALEEKQKYEILQEQQYNSLLARESQALDKKNEYSNKVSNLGGLSNSQSDELSELFLNYNGNNESFESSIQELIKKNEISADIQQEILVAVSDFENTYREQQKMEKKESYAELIAQIRELNPDLSAEEVALLAEKTTKETTKNKFINSKESDLVENTGEDIDSDEFEIFLVKDKAPQEWEDLKQKSRNDLIELGIKTEEEYNNLLKQYGNNVDLVMDDLRKRAYAQFRKNTLKKNIEEGVSNQETSELTSLSQNYDKYSVAELQKKIEELKEKNKYSDEFIENYFPITELNQYSELIKQLGLDTSKTFKNISADVATAQNQILQNLVTKFGSQGEMGKSFEKLVDYIKGSNISRELTNAILKIDPTTLDSGTKEEAKATLMSVFSEAIDQGKIGKDAAKAFVDGYINEIESSGIANYAITSLSGVDQIKESMSKKYTDIVKNYKDAIDTINSNITNGFIDYLDKDKIEEAISNLDLDPSDFLFTDSQGNYQVNTEALNKAVEQQVNDEQEITKEIKKQIEEGINQLQQKQDLLSAIISQAEANKGLLQQERAITKEYAKQQAYKSASKSQTIAEIEADFGDVWKDEATYLDVNDKVIEDMREQWKSLQTQKEALKKSLTDEDYIQELVKQEKAASNAIKNIYKTHTDKTEDFKKSNDKAYKDWQDKTKAVADAQKSLAKAIEAVTEKQKELKAVIEGTNWKSSVDGMYNYNTALDFLTKQTERAKKNFDKVSSISEAKNNFQIYGQGLLDQKAQLTAQNQTYRTAYNNIGKVYNNDVTKLIKSFEDSGQMKFNLADYLVFDEKTGTKINMNALQRAKMPEALKKWIETQGQKANEYLSKVLDNEDKIDQINEEFLEQQRKARDEYISLQDQMIDVLREKYQQEIDDLQNKYDAMNEADNKYLESLQKNLDRQRKLRDQEKNWNDLTNKERKLSLMQRDTSGGNLADVKSLQEEIDDQRTQLLDDAVDQIIEKLTELYELQKETRDAEIEYKQTLIDDVALLKEATEALEKIQTSDDLVNWWKQNVTGIEAFSEQKLSKLTEDWNKLFDAKSNYVASIDDKMKKSIEDANGHLKEVGDQAEEIVRTTSEGITNLAEQSLQEAGEEYKKAVKAAKDALQDAVNAVAKQKEALQAAIDAANESKKAFDDIHAKYIEYLKSQESLKTRQIVYVNSIAYDYGKANTEAARAAKEGKPVNVSSPKTVSTDSQEYKTAINNAKTASSVDANWGKENKKQEQNTNSTWQKTVSLNLVRNTSNNKVYESGAWNTYAASQARQGKPVTGEAVKFDVPYNIGNIEHGVLYWDEAKKTWTFMGKTPDKDFAKNWIADRLIDLKVKYKKSDEEIKEEKNKYLAFAEGGLVNYTGPAWVDGSRSRPEAFLSSEDTRRIGEAARILSDLPILSQPVKEQIPTTTIGDTTIQIDVHVDSIANDYDLDEAMNKVEQRIVNAAKYAGSNVILKKH